jgi:hypothetical protein
MTEQERNLIRDAMMFAVKDMTGRVMREATVQSMIDDFKKAINYTCCCETLKDKYEIVFEDWLKDHKFEQSNNGFCKNGIDYKVNEITWMYIQDVYNL